MDPESVHDIGMRVTLSPALDVPPMLTDAAEEESASDFQSKLLRYRMVNHHRVCAAQIDARAFVPAMRDEVRAWLAPVCDCPDLQRTVSGCSCNRAERLKQPGWPTTCAWPRRLRCSSVTRRIRSSSLLGSWLGGSTILKGRHEDRALTDKKVGLLLRALGIHGERVTKGYRILLTDSVREQIHAAARDYQVPSTQDG